MHVTLRSEMFELTSPTLSWNRRAVSIGLTKELIKLTLCRLMVDATYDDRRNKINETSRLPPWSAAVTSVNDTLTFPTQVHSQVYREMMRKRSGGAYVHDNSRQIRAAMMRRWKTVLGLRTVQRRVKELGGVWVRRPETC